MGYLIFLAIALLQVLGYILIDKTKIKYGRILILLIFLLNYFWLMPYLFAPPPLSEGGPRCGMSDLTVYIAFWLIGGGCTILTHVCYYFAKKNKVS